MKTIFRTIRSKPSRVTSNMPSHLAPRGVSHPRTLLRTFMRCITHTLLPLLIVSALVVPALTAPAFCLNLGVAYAAPLVVSDIVAGGDGGMDSGGAATEGRYIVRLRDDAVRPFSMLSVGGASVVPIAYADGYYLAGSLDDIQVWLDAGLVEYVTPDVELELLEDPSTGGLSAERLQGSSFSAGELLAGAYPMGDPPDDDPSSLPPDDPRFPDQWYLDLIDAAGAWDKGLNGDGIKVAVIDSGVYRQHEDLNYERISGRSFLGIPENYESYDDRTGHGTFVTGLLAAEKGNGMGIAGLSDGVNVLSLRCFSTDGVGDYNSGSGKVSTVSSAIGYAMEQNVDVINMSFGGTGLKEEDLLTLKDILEKAAAQGIILVAAVGNLGNSMLYYPAAFDCVIGVGMVNSAGTVDPNSQRNESVFVTAPGSGVLSLGYALPQSYSTGSGTSYATPMVTAMAAMVKQVNPAIDNMGFAELLRISSVDKGIEGYDTAYGWGLVSVANLVDVLSQPFNITYECTGGSLSGEPGNDYIVSYTIDRATPASLPEPTWDGHLFAGWFDNADCRGEPVTVVPPASVGDVVYYAKWIETSSMAMSSVTVSGIPAVIDESDTTGRTYLAEVPAGTDLQDVAADDIVAVPANGKPTEVSMVDESDGASWTISFSTVSGDPVTYRLNIEVSLNAAPEVVESQASQTGVATPASYDGKTEAVPYAAEVSGWFVDDGETLTYLVSSSTGSGVAVIVEPDSGDPDPGSSGGGPSIIYTPSAADAGSAVTITLRADDGQFLSFREVTVSVDVATIPVSDSVIEPTEASFDKRTGSETGIPVTVRLYGNSLVSVSNGDAPLIAGTDYTYSSMPAIEGGEGLLGITSEYAASLEDGAHTITFTFRDGRSDDTKTAAFTLTILDSTPKYTVVFMNGSAEYHRVPEVTEADTVALPAPPVKKGSTFGGWYTAENGKGIEVTGATPINEDLGPIGNTVTLYAKWTETSGGGDSGGSSGGSSGGPTLPPAPPEPPVQPEPPIVPLWQSPFVDVGPDNWFYSSVEYVCSKGLFEGVSKDTFLPNASMTRAMLVTVIHRLAGLAESEDTGSGFDDVTDGSWYSDAVMWAQGEGIVTGSESRFNPEDSVTREQMVTMLYRYVKAAGTQPDSQTDSQAGQPADFSPDSTPDVPSASSPGWTEEDLAGFADSADVSPWAREAMAWAVNIGLIEGRPGGRLDPTGTATRAEVAAIMQRFASAI